MKIKSYQKHQINRSQNQNMSKDIFVINLLSYKKVETKKIKNKEKVRHERDQILRNLRKIETKNAI
jgi:hypothetical protein